MTPHDTTTQIRITNNIKGFKHTGQRINNTRPYTNIDNRNHKKQFTDVLLSIDRYTNDTFLTSGTGHFLI